MAHLLLKLVALQRDVANNVGNVQLTELGIFVHVDIATVMGFACLDGLFDGAPNLDGGKIVEVRMLAQSGTAPKTRAGGKPKRESGSDVWMGVEEALIGELSEPTLRR